MKRIEALPIETVAGKTKTLLDGVQKKLGLVPNLMRTMAVSPAVLEGYLQFSGALSAGKLPAKLREQIALQVAQLNGCDYCLAAHSALGGMAGLTKDEIEDSRRGSGSDAKSVAVLRLARAIVEQRGQITDDEFASARERGLSDGEIAEVAANVALNVLTNYFNNVAGTVIDFPEAPKLESLQGAACAAGHCAN